MIQKTLKNLFLSITANDCIPSGTQLLQFPSDADPPPGSIVTQACEHQ